MDTTTRRWRRPTLRLDLTLLCLALALALVAAG